MKRLILIPCLVVASLGCSSVYEPNRGTPAADLQANIDAAQKEKEARLAAPAPAKDPAPAPGK
ncbi:MAG: hypothetical protein AB7N76_05845 [Planctomycetota bacterium]